MVTEQTVIHYDGTNRGPIYLKDIGQRSGLGGGRGIYVNGQDQYVNYGSDTTLANTSDVLLSNSVIGADRTGVIRHMTDMGSFHIDTLISTVDSTTIDSTTYNIVTKVAVHPVTIDGTTYNT